MRYIYFILYFLHRLLRLNAYQLIGTKVGKNVRLIKSRILRHVVIGSSCFINKSLIFSATTIGANSTINNSQISGKISFGNNTNISNSQIKGKISFGNNININSCTFNGNIEIGSQSNLSGASISGSFKSKEQLRLLGPQITIHGQVEIGRYTTLNGPNFDIYASLNKVSIGSFCSIARNVSFQEHSHRTDRISTYYINQNVFNDNLNKDNTTKGAIIIENDVWIGTHCVILGGAHISTGAVIAANSVVSGYIPPYAIVGGTPAKILKYRFGKETIDLLLKSEWWNWDIDQLKEKKDLFQLSLNDPDNVELVRTKL